MAKLLALKVSISLAAALAVVLLALSSFGRDARPAVASPQGGPVVGPLDAQGRVESATHVTIKVGFDNAIEPVKVIQTFTGNGRAPNLSLVSATVSTPSGSVDVTSTLSDTAYQSEIYATSKAEMAMLPPGSFGLVIVLETNIGCPGADGWVTFTPYQPEDAAGIATTVPCWSRPIFEEPLTP